MSSEIDKLREICDVRQREYDALPMQKLTVLVEMAAPYSTTNHVRLDSVIAFYGLQKAIGAVFYDLDANNKANRMNAPAPLKRMTNEIGQWWWACSFGRQSYHRDQVVSWKKRWDEQHDELVRFDKKRPRVDHKAGFFKAYSMPMVLKNALAIWFCCVGNKAEIESLLANWDFLGKKTAQGYGQIKAVTVYEMEESGHDWSCFDEEGRPTRAIPLGIADTSDIGKVLGRSGATRCTYHPPYWDNSEENWCYALPRTVG